MGRRRGRAAACQPPAAACVHQMLANQTAPKLPTQLQLWLGLFVYQEGSLWLALQAWGTLQISPLSPRLLLGAICPALDIPFESVSLRGVGWDGAGMGSCAFAGVVALLLNPTHCLLWSHPAPPCLAKLPTNS